MAIVINKDKKLNKYMQDFTRIIPKHHYEEWPQKLGQMNELFQQAEYQTVKKGIREAAIIQINPDNLEIFLEKTNKDRLLFTPLRKTALHSGFKTLVESVKPNEPFLWQGCLTKNYKDSQLFKEGYFKSDHQVVGQMLGYPDCCIAYFQRTFPIDPCPIWVDLEGNLTGFPEGNGMLRYFGTLIVAHLSCSPTCQETKKIGKVWFQIMQEINKDLAKELYRLLAGPMVWNSYHGILQVETPYFVGLNNALYILKKPRIINWQGQKRTLPKKSPLKKEG